MPSTTPDLPAADPQLPTAPAASKSYPKVLTVVALSTFVAMLAYTAPLGNAVTLAAAFSASAAGFTWILASMSVGLAATLLAAGVVADRIGRLRVFQIGAALFVVASVGCALADGVFVYVVARIIAGVGATGMIATGLGLVTSVEPDPRKHATTATWWSVAMGVGIAIGPILVGILDLVGAWRWFYAFLAVLALATAISAKVLVRSQRPAAAASAQSSKFDVLGFILMTAFLIALVTAIVEVRRSTGPFTVLLFAAASALLIAFVWSQLRGTNKLIPTRLLTHPPFLASTIAAFGVGIGVIAALAYAPTFFVNSLGMNTLAAGSMTALWAGTSAVAALLLAPYTARVSGAVLLVIGLTGAALTMLLMLGAGTASSLTALIIGLILTGLATALSNAGLARQSVATVPAKDAATGTAANNTARYIGAAVGMSIVSMIAATGNINEGWNHVVWFGAAASLVIAVAVAFLSRRTR